MEVQDADEESSALLRAPLYGNFDFGRIFGVMVADHQ